MKQQYGLYLAIREHLATGAPLSRLEAIILFGMSDLTKAISALRREGWDIQSKRIPYARALVRLNKELTVKVPKNLPIRDIMLTEYRVAK